MKKIIIIHQWMAGAQGDWRPWLKSKLEKLMILGHTHSAEDNRDDNYINLGRIGNWYSSYVSIVDDKISLNFVLYAKQINTRPKSKRYSSSSCVMSRTNYAYLYAMIGRCMICGHPNSTNIPMISKK